MARKKLQPKPKQQGLPLWLGTFGDLMSLLLTFFILLLSMATFDREKVKQAIGSLQGTLSVLEHGLETEVTTPSDIQATPITIDSPKEEVMNIFASLITEYSEVSEIADGPSIDLEESEDGFIIRIPDDLLFDTASTHIANESGKVFLQRLALEIEKHKNEFNLKIIGNTDNTPYRAGSPIDNWDLSNKRALSVAQNLLALNVPSAMIEVGGDSYFNPISDNESTQGRAKNRRVDIHFSFIGDIKDQETKAKEAIQQIQNTNTQKTNIKAH